LRRPSARPCRIRSRSRQQQKKPLTPALTRAKQKPPDPILLRIYEAYPRKIARATAYMAIDKALGRIAKEKYCFRGDAADFLYQAVVKFGESPAGKKGDYTPHPASWMNGDRFFDDPQEWWKVNMKNGNGVSNDKQNGVIAAAAARLSRDVALADDRGFGQNGKGYAVWRRKRISNRGRALFGSSAANVSKRH
jgi:hypothetical protein